ncbi:hypothetical protein HIM_08495 [Hirsutella minnesotensis 3608]|uniref:Peptidase M43 pregnancy-associated plasma-A domain-containing protein n=1 Tax=Hirsutella minnesotensis 3608 TaxID=1043627 RepID=A0A0F7ZYA3_9HYPO|nr:hypothetical protein HIM_08495 [Hirsutella minnesotensis 3608]
MPRMHHHVSVRLLLCILTLWTHALQAGSRKNRYRCATSKPDVNLLLTTRAFAKNGEACIRADKDYVPPQRTVDVYMHIITSSQAGMGPSDDMMLDQMDVLNKAFRAVNVQYNLQGIARIVNDSWAYGPSQISEGDHDVDNPAAFEMKRQLRRGDYKTLNLYYVESIPDDIGGYSTFPVPVTSRKSPEFIMDGVLVRQGTLPGGNITGFNKGFATVHESGHWNGLFHTFQGGCDEIDGGDMVCDTPAMSDDTECDDDGPGCVSSCNDNQDTCPVRQGPSDKGLDPIHNYMDYSGDDCTTEFTLSQAQHMSNMWLEYRLNSRV